MSESENGMRICVYPGSFDPFTVGHHDVLEHAVAMFDRVYVSVLNNGLKRPVFSVEERVEMIQRMVDLEGMKKIVVSSFNGLYSCLNGMCGVVAAACRFDAATGTLLYAGVGNIALRLSGKQTASLVTADGVLGYGAVHAGEKEQQLTTGTTLIMHSDGISTHFDILECPGILYKSAEAISAELLDRFGMKNDDASCIVMKYLP